MERKEYNGWTNYETWLANLWMDNDEGSQSYWQERAADCCQQSDDAEDAADMLAGELESDADARAQGIVDMNIGLMSGLMLDLISAALLAKQSGLHRTTVLARCKAGKIPGAIRLGRDWLVPAETVLEPAGNGGWPKGKARK